MNFPLCAYLRLTLEPSFCNLYQVPMLVETFCSLLCFAGFFSGISFSISIILLSTPAFLSIDSNDFESSTLTTSSVASSKRFFFLFCATFCFYAGKTLIKCKEFLVEWAKVEGVWRKGEGERANLDTKMVNGSTSLRHQSDIILTPF